MTTLVNAQMVGRDARWSTERSYKVDSAPLRVAAKPERLKTDSNATTLPCELCRRDVPVGLITLHHLLPKQKGGKAEDRVPLCRPCHKQLHATYTNTELAQRLRSVESLQQDEALQPFLSWIRKQKPHRNFRTIESNRRGKRRR